MLAGDFGKAGKARKAGEAGKRPFLPALQALPALLFLLSLPLIAQQSPPPTHDITMVDSVPLGSAMATPLPEAQRKKLEKYDLPELAGSTQALGSQLIEGALPQPLIDYIAQDAKIQQRLSIFQGGLVVIDVRGVAGPMRKRVVLPGDALKSYLKAVSPANIAAVRQSSLRLPPKDRRGVLRIYSGPHEFTERFFDPIAALPKTFNDQLSPLRDLFRAISEDRTVTNSVAGYMPKPGDQLVGDDRKVYRVVRVMDDRIVELRCTSQPTTIYVEVKDLYNYFIGTTGAAQQ